MTDKLISLHLDYPQVTADMVMPFHDESFTASPDETSVLVRDLPALSRFSSEMVAGRVTRVAGLVLPTMGWHAHSSVRISYVLSGWIWLEREGLGDLRLGAGDVLYQVPGSRHRPLAVSNDFEVLDLTIPSEDRTTCWIFDKQQHCFVSMDARQLLQLHSLDSFGSRFSVRSEEPLPKRVTHDRLASPHDVMLLSRTPHEPDPLWLGTATRALPALGRCSHGAISAEVVRGDAGVDGGEWQSDSRNALFGYVLNGRLTMELGGFGLMELANHGALYLPAGTWHKRVRTSSPWELLLVRVEAPYES
jgi:quercetin dioxygenase-like cupin family protein